MALTINETQVEWSTSDSVSVTSGSSQTSDEVTVDQTTVVRELKVKADNAGTPTSGDTIEVKILVNAGDIDADPDVTDEFATAANAVVVAVLDTNAEDPVVYGSIPIPYCKSFKVYMKSNAASNSITVSAQMDDQRSA
jgi:hypothetical protein